MTELTGSATDVGLVLAARFAPLVVLVPFGGVWADRLPRRTVLIAADVARLGLHALLAALFLAGVVEVWHVVAIEALFAAAEAFAVPAYQGLIPQTVPEEAIQSATALTALARNVAQLAGPALGTAIFALAGAGWAFAADAATFLVAVVLVAFVVPRRRGAPLVRTGVLRELVDGLREVRARTWLWVTVLVANLVLLLADGPFAVLGPTRGEEAYGSTETFGVAITVFGAGAVAGAFLAGRLRPHRPLLAGFAALAPLPLAYVAFGLGAPLGLTLAVAFAGGMGASVFDTLWFTALAHEVPPAALSRVSSFDYMGSYASLPIAYALAGPVGAAAGAGTVLVAGGLASMALIAAGAAVPAVRALRARPAPVA